MFIEIDNQKKGSIQVCIIWLCICNLFLVKDDYSIASPLNSSIENFIFDCVSLRNSGVDGRADTFWRNSELQQVLRLMHAEQFENNLIYFSKDFDKQFGCF